jgi:meso-butanediol dehydrogenase/(S,S)-butanediol dehydrogenase/diacetyl reductase
MSTGPARFTDKVALITGAASGIGQASAIQLAREGATVMLADIDATGLSDTQAQIAQLGGNSACFTFDATQEQSCIEAVNSTVEQFGQIDVVGNIAGIVSFWHLHETTTELWNRSLAINLTAPMIISREAMPHLIKTKGNIVNMASTAGLSGQAYNAIYVASKHGVVGLTKSLAVEFAKQGVRVNCICPGGVKTAINEKMRWAENMDDALMARLMPLLDHMAEPEEIASLVAQLASDDSKFVTGAAWRIDGGQLAG